LKLRYDCSATDQTGGHIGGVIDARFFQLPNALPRLGVIGGMIAGIFERSRAFGGILTGIQLLSVTQPPNKKHLSAL
jgi:hypothetical protein